MSAEHWRVGEDGRGRANVCRRNRARPLSGGRAIATDSNKVLDHSKKGLQIFLRSFQFHVQVEDLIPTSPPLLDPIERKIGAF